MKIETRIVRHGYDGKQCHVHARGIFGARGAVITAQRLHLTECDVFDGIELIFSSDGVHFDEPIASRGLARRYFADGSSEVMADATPFYHKKTGKLILTGSRIRYGADNRLLPDPRPIEPCYAVFDEATRDFSRDLPILLPETPDRRYFAASAGCSQITELPSGELLIPIRYKSYDEACKGWNACYTATVMRCSFDGERIECLALGNEITLDVPRGYCEPSIVAYGGGYFLALRNDADGYVTRSDDGLHYATPRPLCFDDGESVGNYNTQQHWLTCGGGLYLVYTRRAENNAHVFRHRAPLFIARLDPERLCLIRETERIAVPERGARLGNFGCYSTGDGDAYVVASEWMQGDRGPSGCAEYGSDNAIFVSRITV